MRAVRGGRPWSSLRGAGSCAADFSSGAGIMRDADLTNAALDAVSASLLTGALATKAARKDGALVRRELDNAFGLSPAMKSALTAAFGPDGARSYDDGTAASTPSIMTAAELDVLLPRTGAASTRSTALGRDRRAQVRRRPRPEDRHLRVGSRAVHASHEDREARLFHADPARAARGRRRANLVVPRRQRRPLRHRRLQERACGPRRCDRLRRPRDTHRRLRGHRCPGLRHAPRRHRCHRRAARRCARRCRHDRVFPREGLVRRRSATMSSRSRTSRCPPASER
jgi:hypothetical protein